MSQKSQKIFPTSTRLYSYVRGSLGRIAKRRYTRDLFDDIVECHESKSENNVSEEEKLLTLLRCFNNFFNKKFDSERLLKGLNYAMTKERSKIMATWLRQKKADNIYVIGRFILHISSFLEDQNELYQNQIKECGNFLNLIFWETTGILDENFILIFSFLSRKGYFRSIMGFILKHFKINLMNLKNLKIQEKSKNYDFTSVDIWIMYLIFPLSFSVKWRIKVEEWVKAETERSELYGSNGSIDDDYANTSVMNMSLMSVSSEYCSEDPHFRQTRLFLKRLISSWCNSVYFNDAFYQYFVSHLSINLADYVLVNTVPVYLIILVLVEPTKYKRKCSIDSILNYNKTLLVQYKLNANPSLGLLNLLVSGICLFQQSVGWKNVGQEEAYGIIVCLHLTILALFDQLYNKDYSEENCSLRCSNHKLEDINNLNENMKLVLQDIKEGLSISIINVLKIAFSGLLDPDVVLPIAYFYQNLKTDLKISESTISGCKLILSKVVPFLRYLWSLCQQAVTTRDSSYSMERRVSDCPEKFFIFRMISEGKIAPIKDFLKFLSILSTMLECVTFHLNTAYQTETRRKLSSSQGPSAAVCSNFLLWPELWNMTKELAILSMGLIKIAVSCINLKETDISDSPFQCRINEIVMKRIYDFLQELRIFYIHVDKLNCENTSIDDHLTDINTEILKINFSKREIQSIFVVNNFIRCSKEKISQETVIEFYKLKFLPQFSFKDLRISLITNLLNLFKSDYLNIVKTEGTDETLNINYEKNSFFTESFRAILTNKSFSFKKNYKIKLNEEEISKDKFIHDLLNDGLNPVNHLFSCDGNHLLYPNPYVENFTKEYKSYYELLGELFALNIINGFGLEKQFSPFFLEKLLFLNTKVYNINDLNVLDMEVAKNLLLLSKTDDELECFNFKFVLAQNTFGKLHTFEIIENGANIPVTKENKNEYIHGVVEFLLDKQIRAQCESFKVGIDSVFPVEIFRFFSTKDFHFFLSVK